MTPPDMAVQEVPAAIMLTCSLTPSAPPLLPLQADVTHALSGLPLAVAACSVTTTPLGKSQQASGKPNMCVGTSWLLTGLACPVPCLKSSLTAQMSSHGCYWKQDFHLRLFSI